MKIRTWHMDMTDKETADLAYWERNVLALRYADGWYNDDVAVPASDPDGPPINGLFFGEHVLRPRFKNWRRVLTLDGGKVTFHIPDDFEVGDLPEVTPNWDGHTTEEKWKRVLESKGVRPTTP